MFAYIQAQQTSTNSNPRRAAALAEWRVTQLLRGLLAQKLEDTIAHVQKKLVRAFVVVLFRLFVCWLVPFFFIYS